MRIAWYLERYHGITISSNGVYCVLKRVGLSRLPANCRKRSNFIDHVFERFPFRIHTIRTDNGHEFQAKFHWHVEDLGMRHVYVKPGRPNLNGKLERSHLTDQLEFHQLLDYTGDVDPRAKLAVWEEFYNLHRPHAGLGGRTTPYEVLREKLLS